jgi:hypothetical protein
LLGERWAVVALSSSGIKEYAAFGKAVLTIWNNPSISFVSEAGGFRLPPHK